MKKIILTVIISSCLVATPVFAATTQQLNEQYTNTLKQLIQSLLQQVAVLQKQLAEKLKAETNTLITQLDSSQYLEVDPDMFRINPQSYAGKAVVISSAPNKFLPRGGSGGTTNYVEVINPADIDQNKLMMQIDSDSAYADIANALQIGTSSFLIAKFYGTGSSPQKFTLSNLFGSRDAYLPTLLVKRVDRCIHGTLQTTILTGTKLSEMFSCSEWKTIFPSTSQIQIVPSPVVSQNTNTTPSDSRYFKINGNGLCLNDGTNGVLSLNGTSLPNKNIISWDRNGIAFTIPDSFGSGNYAVDVMGYTSGYGFCPVVHWGRITVK